MPPLRDLAALAFLAPSAAVAAPAERAPAVTGPVFDAYLDVRIAVRQEAPGLDRRLTEVEDVAPLGGQLAPFLARENLPLEQFARAHRLVARDAGLAGRVAAILDRHGPTAGEQPEAPPSGGAIVPPSGDSRPSGRDPR
ncbi:MAG TPA: hypothetical protein VF406_02665 [Thermodesulfobacteriota bacterium]